MSNHSGGYMLAKMLRVFQQIGLLEAATTQQRTEIAKALWRINWDYDCNWGEILDVEMAVTLNVCICCGKTDVTLDIEAMCPLCADNS